MAGSENVTDILEAMTSRPPTILHAIRMIQVAVTSQRFNPSFSERNRVMVNQWRHSTPCIGTAFSRLPAILQEIYIVRGGYFIHRSSKYLIIILITILRSLESQRAPDSIPYLIIISITSLRSLGPDRALGSRPCDNSHRGEKSKNHSCNYCGGFYIHKNSSCNRCLFTRINKWNI